MDTSGTSRQAPNQAAPPAAAARPRAQLPDGERCGIDRGEARFHAQRLDHHREGVRRKTKAPQVIACRRRRTSSRGASGTTA